MQYITGGTYYGIAKGTIAVIWTRVVRRPVEAENQLEWLKLAV